MKIENGNKSNIAVLDATRKKTAPRPPEGASQAAKPDGNAFSVQFSTAVERMKTSAPEDDEIRREKVEAIRQQLASGTYNISGKDVANKILSTLKG